jgi:hypothetical protein
MDSSKNGNDLLEYIKGEEFLDKLGNNEILKKDCSPCR